MHQHYFRISLVIFLTAIMAHACSCDNSKVPPTNSKPTNEKPQGIKSQPRTQPADSPNDNSNKSISSVQEAIVELEEAIKNNTASPQLKNVYGLLKYLPPQRFKQNADGSESRINEEKNGRELYTKLIDSASFADAMYKVNAPEILGNVVDWLIDKKLLGANEIDEKGNNPLEQLILAFSNKPFSVTSLKHMIDAWMNKGAQITSDKASKLLEALVESSNFDLKIYSNVVDFLTKQGAILENNTKVSALFQEAIERKDKELYKPLLELGADPNIEVPTRYGEVVPLLHVIGRASSKEGRELLQLLIKNPKTNINITNQKGLTVAMEESYEHKYGSLPMLIDDLWQRDDLDINEIKASDNAIGVKGFTLLNMVIDNCSMIPHGHEWQMKEQLNNNKRWLEVLKKISKHKNYFVNDENINLATKKIEKLKEFYYLPDKIYTDAIAIAEEAFNILQNGPRKFQ